MKQRKKCGSYNVTSSLLKYDCHKARKQGIKSIKEDLVNRGYVVNKIEILEREVFGLREIALVEVEINPVDQPSYITNLMPLWKFGKVKE